MDAEASNQRLYFGDPSSGRGEHASELRKPEAVCRIPTCDQVQVTFHTAKAGGLPFAAFARPLVEEVRA